MFKCNCVIYDCVLHSICCDYSFMLQSNLFVSSGYFFKFLLNCIHWNGILILSQKGGPFDIPAKV